MAGEEGTQGGQGQPKGEGAGTENRMNVAAVKRFDPYARDIVSSATHVALYTFEGTEWEKTSIEGALFVYRRAGKPAHSLLIMNRLSTDNLLEPLAAPLEIQLQVPFLLYRNAKTKIYGIWFYDKNECVKIASTVQQLVKSADREDQPEGGDQHQHRHQPVADQPRADIFSMLTKAQRDYDTSRQRHTSDQARPQPQQQHRPQPSQPQQPQPQQRQRRDPEPARAPPAFSIGADGASQSVMDFFAKAGGGGGVGVGGLPVHVPATAPSVPMVRPALPRPLPEQKDGPLLLQRLMSDPAHSVEHIEKQQRSVTPKTTPASAGKGAGRAANGDDRRKRGDEGGTPAGARREVEEVDLRGLTLRAESPKRPAPALMPPTMFTSSASKAIPVPGKAPPPSEFGSTPTRPPAEEPKPEPLTKNQLLQAFNYLIKNDAEFVTKLHEAYVKSFSELVS